MNEEKNEIFRNMGQRLISIKNCNEYYSDKLVVLYNDIVLASHWIQIFKKSGR